MFDSPHSTFTRELSGNTTVHRKLATQTIAEGGRTPARRVLMSPSPHEKGGRTPARGHPASPHIPRPYYVRSRPVGSYIVGTGAVRVGGGAPCGRPSPVCPFSVSIYDLAGVRPGCAPCSFSVSILRKFRGS